MSSAAGGFAEYAVTDSGRAHKIPANNMSYEQAACMPVAVQTMHNALVGAGRLKKGESVLIQGASSGVGLLGMQIAKHMGASIVMGTSTNEGRRARLKEFGCDLALDTSDPKWPDKVKEATGGKGVDLIVDQVSASVANQNMEAAAILGRIVNVGRLGGMKGEFNFDLHALKRIDYIGVTFRTRTPDEVRAIVKAARADLWPAIEAGKLHLPIDKTFPLSQAAEALAHMKANAHFGKIVLVSETPRIRQWSQQEVRSHGKGRSTISRPPTACSSARARSTGARRRRWSTRRSRAATTASCSSSTSRARAWRSTTAS